MNKICSTQIAHLVHFYIALCLFVHFRSIFLNALFFFVYCGKDDWML